jgi:hypothetical protein
MDCVVAPVDQVLPVACEEVSTTLPPEQKVVGPPAVTVGVAGPAVTVTAMAGDVLVHQPLVPSLVVSVYDPVVVAVMDWVVAPVDHEYAGAVVPCNTTELPEQKVVGPMAVTCAVVFSKTV